MALPETPDFADLAELRRHLRDLTGFCDCATDDALPLLREMLQAAAARSDAASGPAEAFRAQTEVVENLLSQSTRAGYACWFVYALERADLLTHGFNVTDIWITERGRKVLAGLLRWT
jgi:hypothetical protein